MTTEAAANTFDAKIVLLGTQAVGKTSIVTRYVNRTFSPEVRTTIGAAFLTKTVSVDNYRIKMQLWDTAGQERFRSMAPMYYRGANVAIVAFDVTSPQSFEDLKAWVAELQKNHMDGCAMFVAGNKVDLVNLRRVSVDAARAYAQSVGAVYFEVSAKTDQGINELFLDIAQGLVAKYCHLNNAGRAGTSNLSITAVPQNQGSSCCG